LYVTKASHDQQLERKLVVAFKAAPPEHTIAGEEQGQAVLCMVLEWGGV
jgi:hypothetical protein